MPRLKPDKEIWVKQIFTDKRLWRFKLIKEHEYKEFLNHTDEMGPNPFLKMYKAPKWFLIYRGIISFLTNKYVDKIIFMIVGYFLKTLLDKYFK